MEKDGRIIEKGKKVMKKARAGVCSRWVVGVSICKWLKVYGS